MACGLHEIADNGTLAELTTATLFGSDNHVLQGIVVAELNAAPANDFFRNGSVYLSAEALPDERVRLKWTYFGDTSSVEHKIEYRPAPTAAQRALLAVCFIPSISTYPRAKTTSSNLFYPLSRRRNLSTAMS